MNESPEVWPEAWNAKSAEIAYEIIATYVEHAQISGIIIAMLASIVGEEKLKTVAQSPYWQDYMASKRSISNIKDDIDKLTALFNKG